MKNSQAARALVNSDSYQSLILELTEFTDMQVEPTYADVFVRLDSAKMERAGITSEEALELLRVKRNEIKQYSIKKFTALDQNCEEIEEYPLAEALPGDERSRLISVNNYSQGFLLTNIIEYLLVQKGSSDLAGYIKASKIPNAKEYTEQIFGFISDE